MSEPSVHSRALAAAPAVRTRIRRAAACAVFLPLVLCHCDDATTPSTGTVISSGFSFGECLGFCFQEVSFRGTVASYVMKDQRSGELVEGDVRLAIEAWRALANAVDLDALQALPDIIGCPDCADGGAEWIQVWRDGETTRVAFEYGTAIESIQPLLDVARAQRSAVLPHDDAAE